MNSHNPPENDFYTPHFPTQFSGYPTPPSQVTGQSSQFSAQPSQFSSQSQFSAQPSQISAPPSRFSAPPSECQIDRSAKKARGDSFTMAEDEHLVKTWLQISLDSVHGNEQSKTSYWLRVYEYFHKHKKFPSNRDEKSLMQRWSKIQAATNKFCGHFAQIENRHQSGVNEQDKIAQAKQLFQDLNKSKFPFEHCWTVLRHQPKWLEELQKKKQPNRFTSVNTSPSPSTPGTPIELTDDDGPINDSVNLERPEGRKAAKRKASDCKNNDPNFQILELLRQMKDERNQSNEERKQANGKKLALLEQRLEFDKDKFRLEQMKEQERIMLVDTSDMPPHLQQYYRGLQREIMGRGASDV